jgi:hypothetical protein
MVIYLTNSQDVNKHLSFTSHAEICAAAFVNENIAIRKAVNYNLYSVFSLCIITVQFILKNLSTCVAEV